MDIFIFLLENSTSVYAAVEYVNSIYPKYPEKPTLPNLTNTNTRPSPNDYRKYADELEKFNQMEILYEEKKNECLKISKEINDGLEKFIKEMSELNSIVPEIYRDKVWNLAMENGYHLGYNDVYYELCKLIKIFKP